MARIGVSKHLRSAEEKISWIKKGERHTLGQIYWGQEVNNPGLGLATVLSGAGSQTVQSEV